MNVHKASSIFKVKRINSAVILSILFLGSFLFYFRSLNFNFIGDDWGIIWEKKSLFQNPQFWSHIFLTSAFTTGLKDAVYNYCRLTSEVSYRPLNTLSYFWDYKLWGMRPFGFHTTNVLFHCGNVILIYVIISIISGSQLWGFLAGLLFAVHPFTGEAVSVVSFREDLMALFFILLSCLVLLRYILGYEKTSVYLLLSFMFYIFAILCKENSVVAWGIYFYLIITSRQKSKLSPRAIWFLIAGGIWGSFFAWMRLAYNPPTAINPLMSNGKTLVYTLGDVLGRYILYFFIPWHFPFYFPWQFSPPGCLTFGVCFHTLIFLSAIIVGSYLFLKTESKVVKFGLVWTAVFFTPLFFIKYLPSLLAVRYLYIPGVGVITIIAWGLKQELIIRNYRKFILPAFLVYTIYLGSITQKEISRWENDVVFYENQKKEFPHSWLVHKKYGDFLLSCNYLYLALKEYTNAYLIASSNSEVLEKLASTLFALREYREAEKFYLQALEVKPASVTACKGLGVIYGMRSQKQKALYYLNRALKLAPGDKDVLENIRRVKAGEKNFKLFVYPRKERTGF